MGLVTSGQRSLDEHYDLVDAPDMIACSSLVGLHRIKCLEFEVRSCAWHGTSYFLATQDSAVLGFAEFAHNTYDHDKPRLRNANALFKELHFLKVEPEFQHRGIGPVLLEYVKQSANSEGKLVLLRPERPGKEGGFSEGERRLRFPLSTERLQRFYSKHGFRRFTKQEVNEYVSWMEMHAPSPTRNARRTWVDDFPADVPDVAFDGMSGAILRLLAWTPFGDDAVKPGRRNRDVLDDEYRLPAAGSLARSIYYPYVAQHLVQEEIAKRASDAVRNAPYRIINPVYQ